jgi:glycosyltransferase involved in cell wall biosynthesis
MVIAEAFAAGLPVVASRLGAMTELVADGETGWHFKAGDANALADAVQKVLADPRRREMMRQNARRVFEERFTAASSYDRLIEIYRQAVSARAL